MKVPLAVLPTFDVSLTEEAKPFCMVVSTWGLFVVLYQNILLRLSKTSGTTIKSKHRSVFFVLTTEKNRAEKRYSKNIAYIKSRTKMKNEKSHKENVVQVEQDLVRLFMTATLYSHENFCVELTWNKLYKKWTHKSYRLISVVNFLLV